MKSKILLIALLFLGIESLVYSQNETDALRYSRTMFGGTARFQGMGGAFGALGGDFSTLSYNPAGIAIYRSSEFAFTPSFQQDNTSSTYLNTNREDFKYKLNLNNIGYVATFNADRNSGWLGCNLGVGYNRFNTFNQNAIIEGNNDHSSMSDFFMDKANGTSPENLNSYWESLAFDTYVIDTIPGETTQYQTPVFYPVKQRKTVSTKGSTGEWAFSFGANYNNVLYLGATFGIDKINYEENVVYSEDDYKNVSPNFDYFDFKQYIETTGTGYTFKLGAIVKPTDFLRLGLALHLPTFYDMKDEYDNNMASNLTGGKTVYPRDKDGNLLDKGSYDYSLTTPMRTIGSIALQIQKVAMLSFDCEYVDYTKIRLRDGGNGYDFGAENDNIKNMYKATANLHAGAEVKFGALALRGGYSYYGSPYKSDQLNKNSDYSVASAGFGIRQEKFFIDAAYNYGWNTEKGFLYNNSTLTNNDAFSSKLTTNKFIVTIGFRF